MPLCTGQVLRRYLSGKGMAWLLPLPLEMVRLTRRGLTTWAGDYWSLPGWGWGRTPQEAAARPLPSTSQDRF